MIEKEIVRKPLPPGSLMLSLGLLMMGIGIVAGVPMVYSNYAQTSEGTCPTAPNPLAYAAGPPAAPLSGPQIPAATLAEQSLAARRPATGPAVTIAAQAGLARAGCPMGTVNQKGRKGGVPGHGQGQAPQQQTASTGAPGGNGATGGTGQAGAAPAFGMFHRPTLSSQMASGVTGQLSEVFLAGNAGIANSLQPGQVTSPVVSALLTQTPIALTVQMAGLPPPQVPTMDLATVNGSQGNDTPNDPSQQTGINYIDSIMAGAATAFTSGPGSGVTALPRLGQNNGTSNNQPTPNGSAASLSAGSALGIDATSVTAPTSNLVTAQPNGQPRSTQPTGH
jgi:hypothetical protein